MNRANQPSALRSLGVGALIGAGLLALVALLEGCAPQVQYSAIPASPPPIPRTNLVILAVESQRASVRTAIVAPGDTNPVTLTIRTAVPASIAAAAPIVKRGTLSLGWSVHADPRVTGYRIYYGLTPMVYFYSANAGSATNATLVGLDEGVSYSAAVVAYFSDGTESRPSNEVSGATPIYVSLTTQCWQVSAYGVVGKTNQMQVSTNLATWETIYQWVGNGNAVSVLHTNRAQAWFRVEAN